MAGRLKRMGSAAYQADGDPRTSGPGFKFTEHPDRLDQPHRWTRPRLIFVNSMSDLFHPDASASFLNAVFDVMETADRHTYQVLTKRAPRMRGYVRARWSAGQGSPPVGIPRNIWLGTSIESDRFTFRAHHLRDTPAAVRFLSLEPLLGPLPSLDLTGIGWVIVGAESGHGARPMDIDWVRPIRDRCYDQGIPFFFKQDAEPNGRKIHQPELDGTVWQQMPGDTL
jgi:protein gp37